MPFGAKHPGHIDHAACQAAAVLVRHVPEGGLGLSQIFEMSWDCPVSKFLSLLPTRRHSPPSCRRCCPFSAGSTRLTRTQPALPAVRAAAARRQRRQLPRLRPARPSSSLLRRCRPRLWTSEQASGPCWGCVGTQVVDGKVSELCQQAAQGARARPPIFPLALHAPAGHRRVVLLPTWAVGI